MTDHDTPIPSEEDLFHAGLTIGRERAHRAVPLRDLWFPPNTPAAFIEGIGMPHSARRRRER